MRVLTALFFALALVAGPVTVLAQDDVETLKAQVVRLSDANLELAKVNAEQAKENAALRAEVASLKNQLSVKAGNANGVGSLKNQPSGKVVGNANGVTATTAPAASAPPATDPMAVVRAMHAYVDAEKAIQSASLTDIQIRQKWFEAAKALEAVLAKNPAVVTCTIKNVQFNPASQSAGLTVSGLGIKSTNVDLSDIIFNESRQPLSVAASEDEAEKITIGSAVTIAGVLSSGIDFKKPVAQQPIYFAEEARQLNNRA